MRTGIAWEHHEDGVDHPMCIFTTIIEHERRALLQAAEHRKASTATPALCAARTVGMGCRARAGSARA